MREEGERDSCLVTVEEGEKVKKRGRGGGGGDVWSCFPSANS